MLRTAFRATSSKAWLRSSATRAASRSLHAQAASSSTTVPRARMALGAAAALGFSAWAVASQSKINMEEPAQTAAAAPTPAIIQSKSVEFAEVVAEEVTAAAPVADEAGAAPATSVEGESTPEGEKQEEDAGSAAFDPPEPEPEAEPEPPKRKWRSRYED
ncbi:hypothetical protein FRC00_009492 [Tulasnella sp. 408]|nr:hypothetical protein FRC00_009492 [Tulasnella sp. 408]